jgi:hypothetical protein
VLVQLPAEDHQIALLVVEAGASCNLRRTLLDGVPRWDEETTRIALVAGLPPAPRHGQILVQLKMLPLGTIDKPVDRFMPYELGCA